MSQENLHTMIMQNFGGVKEVYYGIVQVVNMKSKCLFETRGGRFVARLHSG